ncbi:carotenoid 9,10(9',10')-cleavage dioxygenase-like [Salvia splendens]|uniref:carotenoid 9,10(9',10')-cleavage dioxygenase-like n=1 Tax=Salvia splendens TaxID=180675 RepID=UPI001C2748C9|nr:carotenoid 9,10(9',10')-cleavage dioxygenase-like [Salvia splendens]
MMDYDKRLSHSFTAHPKVDPFTANAWEEGDEVVLITCRLHNLDLDMVNGVVKEKLENFTNELYEKRFNLKNGLASLKKLSESSVDFPRVNESYTGRDWKGKD